MKGHTPFLPTKRKSHGLSPNETLHVPATFHVVFTPFSDTQIHISTLFLDFFQLKRISITAE